MPVKFSLLAVTGLASLALLGTLPGSAAVQPQDRDRETKLNVSLEEAKELYAELQRQLNEIQRQLEVAENNDDEARVDELQEAAESVTDRLTALQRLFAIGAPERHDEAEEFAELERHVRQLELERLETEIHFGRLELIQRLAEVSDDPELCTAYAIMHVQDSLEPEQAIGFLTETLSELDDSDDSQSAARLIRIRLIDLYHATDQPEAARQQLKALILGQ